MHANDAPRVSAGRAGLLAEARREGAVPEGKLRAIKHLAAVDVREHDLGRGDEVHVGVHVIEVLVELGQLAGTKERVMVGDDRWPPLLEAGGGVRINHEVDERALHTSAHPAEKVEAGTGKLDATVEVDHSRGRAQVPMGEGCEVKLARNAPAPYLRIIGVILAKGHGLVGDVGNGGHEIEELLLHGATLLVKFGDAALVGRNLGLGGLRLGRLPLAHELANRLGGRVSICLKTLDLGDGATALFVKLKESRTVPMGVLPRFTGLVHEVGIVSDELDVEHVYSLALDGLHATLAACGVDGP